MSQGHARGWLPATRVLLLLVLAVAGISTEAGSAFWIAWCLHLMAHIGLVWWTVVRRQPMGFLGPGLHVAEVLVILLLVLGDRGWESQFALLPVLTGTLAGFHFGLRPAVVVALTAACGHGMVAFLHTLPEPPPGWERHQGWPFMGRMFMEILLGSALPVLAGILSSNLHRQGQILEGTRAVLERTRLDHEEILDRLAQGVVVIDAAGRLLYHNAAAQTLLGLRLFGGQAFDRLLRQRDWTRELLDLWKDSVVTDTPLSREIQVDSQMWYQLAASPLWDGTQLRHVVLTLLDTSPIRKMEAEVRTAERMATLGNMAARMAHEIRNPMATIMGSVQLLQDGSGVGSDDQQLLELVRRESARLDRLLTEFLEFSRRRQPSPREVNLAELLNEVAGAVRARSSTEQLPATVIEVNTLPDATPTVDRDMLYQILLNLALNALQALPLEGLRMIQLKAEPLSGSGTVITIRDSGPGMSPDVLRMADEAFFTTKQGGFGLGLTICRQLAQSMGAELRLESQVGGGTIATVILPSLPTSRQELPP